MASHDLFLQPALGKGTRIHTLKAYIHLENNSKESALLSRPYSAFDKDIIQKSQRWPDLCNYHYYPILDHFHHPQNKSSTHWQLLSNLLYPPAPGNY